MEDARGAAPPLAPPPKVLIALATLSSPIMSLLRPLEAGRAALLFCPLYSLIPFDFRAADWQKIWNHHQTLPDNIQKIAVGEQRTGHYHGQRTMCPPESLPMGAPFARESCPKYARRFCESRKSPCTLW